MRFFTLASVCVSALATAVAASSSTVNPFKVPTSGYSFTAGSSTTINWTPTTSGTVTLQLRSGASNNLNSGTTIASSIPNSGSYTWTVPTSIVRGSDYAIEIISDSDTSETNYTPQFVIDSDNTVNTSSASSASASGSATTGSASTGSTDSVSMTSTGSMTTMTSSASVSASASASGSASSASGSKSTASATRSSSGSSSSTSSSSSSDSTPTTSVPDSGAAMQFKLQGGLLAVMLGVVAVF
ncbi:MAG: hypothetical protein M1834_007761 [Cirrosporium novae-zelandiae]|nr:MAG: hypothetical protein M1834_007761 [Cirrosporium novae-zelandiae]